MGKEEETDRAYITQISCLAIILQTAVAKFRTIGRQVPYKYRHEVKLLVCNRQLLSCNVDILLDLFQHNKPTCGPPNLPSKGVVLPLLRATGGATAPVHCTRENLFCLI